MKRLTVAVLAALALASPASATGNVVTTSGEGDVMPGVVTVPVVNVWTFRAPGSSLGVAGAQNVICSLTGQGTESLAAAAGTFSGSCGTVELTGCTYTRAGTAFTGACTNGASASFVYQYIPSSRFTFTGTVQQ